MRKPTPQAANGEPLTVEAALQTITSLERFEVGLYQRTEGIMWMLWGLVTAGIYFTYATMGQALENFPEWAPFLWMPWVAAGVTATYSLWRSAHLTVPSEKSKKEGLRDMWISGGLFMAVMFLGGMIFGIYGDRFTLLEPAYFQILMGVASFAMAFLARNSEAGRRMLVAVGILSVATALAAGVVVPYASVGQAYMVQTLVGVAAVGGGWFAGGLYLTVKG